MRELAVTLEPGQIELEESGVTIQHDVGELNLVKTAEGQREITVRVWDESLNRPVPAKVHAGGKIYPANAPFKHLFRSERDERTGSWSKELIWVEVDGHPNAEVRYEVVVR